MEDLNGNITIVNIEHFVCSRQHIDNVLHMYLIQLTLGTKTYTCYQLVCQSGVGKTDRAAFSTVRDLFKGTAPAVAPL